MQRVILDTTTVSTVDELHDVLKHQLGLPDYYGKNLDALWDCLTSWVDLPLTVEWRGFSKTRDSIGEYVDKLLEMFREAERELEEFKIELT